MKRISTRHGLTVFVFVSMLGFSHSIIVDDFWGWLFWTGQLIFFTTSYFYSDRLDVSVSSFKQLSQLSIEIEAIPALLMWIGSLLIVFGSIGLIYFV